jgi:hypothetical protein
MGAGAASSIALIAAADFLRAFWITPPPPSSWTPLDTWNITLQFHQKAPTSHKQQN